MDNNARNKFFLDYGRSPFPVEEKAISMMVEIASAVYLTNAADNDKRDALIKRSQKCMKDLKVPKDSKIRHKLISLSAKLSVKDYLKEVADMAGKDVSAVLAPSTCDTGYFIPSFGHYLAAE